MEPISTTAIVGASAWFGNKLLGPTVEVIGDDLRQLYEKGRDRITAKAIKKSGNLDIRGQTNLRVTREVFWNGSFTDESICAEYFGGVLASSRSEDGRNDSGVYYVDIIKSMSSGQLKMHYIIYRCLQKVLLADNTKQDLNPGAETIFSQEELFIPTLGIQEQLGNEDIGAILHGLYAQALIGDFAKNNHVINDNKIMPYLQVHPTALGVQLFAIANNKFADWRNYSRIDFGEFEDVHLPKFFTQSFDELMKITGLKKEAPDPNVLVSS